MKIVGCIPNISEGNNAETISALAQSVRAIAGVELLHIDSGVTTNRSVFSFYGEPEQILQAAFAVIAKAAELIDMRQQKGAHPRIGAVDVCPFVPIEDVSMNDCISLSNKLGERVGRELAIPVYLYAQAAKIDERKDLSFIRKGNYEKLSERMQNGFTPDYGPSAFNARSGATVIGARDILIAYNVNIKTAELSQAKELAKKIRARGLNAVKAIAWHIEEYKKCQISMNLLNYHQTPMHTAFEAIKEEAKALDIVVSGSEIIGLVPLEAMLAAGTFYLKRDVSREELLKVAISELGLAELTPFNANEKIIEYALANRKLFANSKRASLV